MWTIRPCGCSPNCTCPKCHGVFPPAIFPRCKAPIGLCKRPSPLVPFISPPAIKTEEKPTKSKGKKGKFRGGRGGKGDGDSSEDDEDGEYGGGGRGGKDGRGDKGGRGGRDGRSSKDGKGGKNGSGGKNGDGRSGGSGGKNKLGGSGAGKNGGGARTGTCTPRKRCTPRCKEPRPTCTSRYDINGHYCGCKNKKVTQTVGTTTDILGSPPSKCDVECQSEKPPAAPLYCPMPYPQLQSMSYSNLVGNNNNCYMPQMVPPPQACYPQGYMNGMPYGAVPQWPTNYPVNTLCSQSSMPLLYSQSLASNYAMCDACGRVPTVPS